MFWLRRTCIVSGETRKPASLFRFVLSPEGDVAPDFSGKLPGCGAWVSLSRGAIEKAIKSGAFAKAFRAKISAPADLPDRVEAGMVKTAQEALGLARRAGTVVNGFEKTKAALAASKAVAVIIAADAGQDGVRKITPLARGTELLGGLAGVEIADALGQETVVYAALLKGPHTRRAIDAIKAVAAFRAENQKPARPG